MADNSNKPRGTFAKLMSSQTTSSPSQDEEKEKAFKATFLKPINQSVVQSTDRSTDQSVDRLLTDKETPRISSSRSIVDRPKAFYITERLDKRLDEAVRYFQEVHGIKKADRSTVVNAIMDNEENWSATSLDQLVGRLISQLTSRLTTK